MDLDYSMERFNNLKNKLKNNSIYAISSITHKGIRELLFILKDKLQQV